MCWVGPEVAAGRLACLLAARADGGAPPPDHPVLHEAAHVDWEHLDCPAEMPALLGCLLDAAVAARALDLLGSVLLDGPFSVSVAAPFVLPSLIVLADEVDVALLPDLMDWLVWVAVMSEPVQSETDLRSLSPGARRDRREWALCRRVFAMYAEPLHRLVEQAPPKVWSGPEEIQALLEPRPA